MSAVKTFEVRIPITADVVYELEAPDKETAKEMAHRRFDMGHYGDIECIDPNLEAGTYAREIP